MFLRTLRIQKSQGSSLPSAHIMKNLVQMLRYVVQKYLMKSITFVCTECSHKFEFTDVEIWLIYLCYHLAQIISFDAVENSC